MTKMLHLTSVNPGQGPPGEEGLGCYYRVQTRLLSKLLGHLGTHIQKHYVLKIAFYSWFWEGCRPRHTRKTVRCTSNADNSQGASMHELLSYWKMHAVPKMIQFCSGAHNSREYCSLLGHVLWGELPVQAPGLQ